MMVVILNLAILDSAILVFPLKLTHTCHDWFPLFSQKNFNHSFWLNLMMAAILNSTILYSAICNKKLHSCILTQIDDCSHLEFCYLGLSHFAQKKLHSFILTQLDDGSHLEFCHVGFRHWHLGFKHLVIFSQIHSKTLFINSYPDSN